ncbi:hypothetical protein GMSM_45970 [Geomonas sp. Red276]
MDNVQRPFYMVDFIVIFHDNTRTTGSFPCPGATPAEAGKVAYGMVRRKYPSAEDISVFPSDNQCQPTAPPPPNSALKTWYSAGY